MSGEAVLPGTVSLLDQLKVPDGPTRAVVIELVRLVEIPDVPGHSAVASAGLTAALRQLIETYKERSPLELELDILRGERHLRELRERGEIE